MTDNDVELLKSDLDDAQHLASLLAQVRDQWKQAAKAPASAATLGRIKIVVEHLTDAHRSAAKLASAFRQELLGLSVQGASTAKAKTRRTSRPSSKTPNPGVAGRDSHVVA